MWNTHYTYAVFSLGDHLEVRGCLLLGLFNLSTCRQIIFLLLLQDVVSYSSSNNCHFSITSLIVHLF